MSHKVRCFAAFTALSILPLACLPIACGGSPTQEPAAAPPASAPQASSTSPAPASQPTVEEAERFIAQVDRDVREHWVARDRAMWVNQTYINDDTEALSAAGEAATAAYFTKAIKESARFANIPGLPPEVARQLHLLKISQVAPAPSDPKEGSELAEIEAWMTGAYGKGKYQPPPGSPLAKSAGKYLKRDGKAAKGAPVAYTLGDLSRVISTSRNYDELTEAWKGWHDIGAPMRDKFARYVELANKGSREIGFADMGALWRSRFDMTPDQFEAEVERLWQQLRPLHEQLHCYVRAKLREKYGKDKVPETGPIPAQLLGNMWSQTWDGIYDLVEPYKGEASLDVTKSLKDKKYDAVKMVKTGESFFTSLGFDPLPKTFWERSMLTKPQDRDVVCHASAWDVTWNDDLRIKMCVEPTEDELITIHHELGHDYYFSQYYKLPILFQDGANDGFQEGIGDTIALSVTPQYLKNIGLLPSAPDNPKQTIDRQMKMALTKVAFLPSGMTIDKWRWDVFSGKVPKEKYNEAWWALRKKYEGIVPPVTRSEADFDPGAKFHVPGNTSYIRYFMAAIYQFQFHRALCKAAGHTGPLYTCSIYGNKEAGKKLAAMLSMGLSKPWPEALAALSGETQTDASAMLEYFAPLREYLAEQTKGMKCGW